MNLLRRMRASSPTGRALTPLNRTSFVKNTIKPACGCKNFISFVAFGATFSFRSKVNTLKPHFVRKNTIHPRFARRNCTPFCHSVTSFLSEAGLKRNKEKIFNLICLKPLLILSLPYALPFQGKVKGLSWPFALLNSRKKRRTFGWEDPSFLFDPLMFRDYLMSYIPLTPSLRLIRIFFVWL